MQKPLLNFYWIKDRPWRLLAFGFGSGLSRYAPGTVGTLWAWVLGLGFPLAFPNSLESEIIFLLFVGFFVGIWACGKSGVEIKTPDHSGMVWDEMLAFWFILMMIYPTSWFYQILAFILFRFFDIVKPGPIAWVDQFFKNWQPTSSQEPWAEYVYGLGVMLDDILAACCTLICISILIRLGI